ncbi:MAG: GAF domain-containing protein [Lysobacterales bacterium]
MSRTSAAPVDRFLAELSERRAQLDDCLVDSTTADEVAWTLCEFAGRELELDDCVVYLALDQGRALAQRAAWGAKRVAERVLDAPIRLNLSQGVVGTCALVGAPQLIADTRLDARYLRDDARRLSELAVPMRAPGVVLGVIDTEHAQPDAFDSRHVRALLAIAEAGVARLLSLEKKPAGA